MLMDRDMDIMAESGMKVAYNPSSNMKLASGVAPITKMLARGIVVGLGTDSNLSNNNVDMFEEMRVGAMLQKLPQGMHAPFRQRLLCAWRLSKAPDA